MIKAIIFDYFGVIGTDTLTVIVDELRTTDASKADHIVQLVGAASKGTIDPDISRAEVADTLGLTGEEYANKIKNGETRNQQLLNYIKDLRPRFNTGLLSNIIRGGLEVRFTSEELETYFDVVVSSGDIGYAKPEPQAYEITVERLGVRLNECIMVDDREDYCRGAIGVGMRAVQYQSFKQMKHELSSLLSN